MKQLDDNAKRQAYAASLNSLSTVDGREILFTLGLRQYLSEGALHRYRAMVMIENMIAFAESDLDRRPVIESEQKALLRGLTALDVFDPMAVAEYDHFGRKGEEPFEHDVKAVEFYLRERLQDLGLTHLQEWLHFPMTSEDNNNLAWNLMLRDAINNEWLPVLLAIMDALADYAVRYASVPVLGITHDMNASPTTFGKRFSYDLSLICKALDKIKSFRLSGKYGGAVGNNNPMLVVAPEFDMRSFARQFVESFGFTYEQNTNQRNSHLNIVQLLQEIKLVNTLVSDLCHNICLNVAMGWLAVVSKGVGSSIMPHKINPWFFEVAQSYVEQANRLIDGAVDGLLQSDFERDLTDHPWERAYGEMLGKSLVALRYVEEGLLTLRVNDEYALKQLQATPEILTEAVQIAGRISGVANIYMIIKALARGRKLDRQALNQIIRENIEDEELRDKLLTLQPKDYTGDAAQTAVSTAEQYRVLRQTVEQGLLDPFLQIQYVLFDFDGTLQVGDKAELELRLQAVSDLMGLGFTAEEIRNFGNRSDYLEMRALMVSAYNSKTQGVLITQDQFQAVNNRVTGQFDNQFYLAEHARELLDTLKRLGKKKGLVTTRGPVSLPRLLEKYKIAEYFDVIIKRDDCARRKPHPEPLMLAWQELGGIDPAQAMYVGDLQVDDVIAGKAMGFQTVLINPNELDPNGAQPDYHFNSLLPLLRKFSRY